MFHLFLGLPFLQHVFNILPSPLLYLWPGAQGTGGCRETEVLKGFSRAERRGNESELL